MSPFQLRLTSFSEGDIFLSVPPAAVTQSLPPLLAHAHSVLALTRAHAIPVRAVHRGRVGVVTVVVLFV